MNKNDTDYYRELHEAARHYDTKLWTLPSVFVLVVGLAITGLDWKMNSFGGLWQNIVVFLVVWQFARLLLLKFIKEHAHAVWIQKKINAFDETANSDKDNAGLMRRAPLFSQPASPSCDGKFSVGDMVTELKVLKGLPADRPYFNRFRNHEKLLYEEVSKPVMKTMLWTSRISGLAFVVSLLLAFVMLLLSFMY